MAERIEYDDRLSLASYPFPELSEMEILFSTIDTDPVLLEEARRRGFYRRKTEAGRLFRQVLDYGGKMVYKPDTDRAYLDRAVPYLLALMRSITPRHEDKEAVCSMLIDELVSRVEPKE